MFWLRWRLTAMVEQHRVNQQLSLLLPGQLSPLLVVCLLFLPRALRGGSHASSCPLKAEIHLDASSLQENALYPFKPEKAVRTWSDQVQHNWLWGNCRWLQPCAAPESGADRSCRWCSLPEARVRLVFPPAGYHITSLTITMQENWTTNSNLYPAN